MLYNPIYNKDGELGSDPAAEMAGLVLVLALVVLTVAIYDIRRRLRRRKFHR